MAIRKADTDDANTIAAIHRASRQAAMPWLPDLHSPAGDLWFYKNRVIPEQDVAVYICEGNIGGFIASSKGWLNHLYIHPDLWGRGMGTSLLLHALARHEMLQLWVFQKNKKARSFYKKHGFSEVEQTDGSANEEKEPDVRMNWHA